MKKIFIQSFFIILLLSFGSACNKEDQTCISDPKSNCVCPLNYLPVCGCNGVTYGNACDAECSGITEYTQGACD